MRWVRAVAILALSYMLSAKLGLRLASVNPYATAVWPPIGIAFAALLLWGYRLWPGVFIGAFLANLTTGAGFTLAGLAVSLGNAAGNTLEALLGAYLVQRFAGGRNVFGQARNVFGFALLAAVSSTMVSATIGVAGLFLAGLAKSADAPAIWATWWIGDAVGDLVLAPALVLWARDWRVRWTRTQAMEMGLLLAGLGLLAPAAFTGLLLSPESAGRELAFLCTPGLLWAALRFGQRETATLLLLVAGAAITGWIQEARGGGATYTALLELQAYLGTTAVTMLVVAAEVFHRRRHEQTLERQTQLLSAVQESLRRSEQRLQSILDNSTTVVYLKDADGRYLFINRRYEHIFHLSREQVIGKTDRDLFPEAHAAAYRQNDLEVLRSAQPLEFEEVVPLDDGLHTYISIKFPVADPADGSVGVCGISTDITERKRLDERLRQVAKLEGLGILAGGIAHDFNNLLTGILGNASLLAGDVPVAGKQGLARQILDAGQRAADLTNQLLAYAGKGRFVIQSLDLSRQVQEITSLLHAAIPKNVTVELQLSDGLPAVDADRGQLQQVIMNLVINAAEAIGPAPGTVVVRTHAERLEAPRSIGPDELAPGRFIVLTVSDTGCGMTPDVVAKIFDPFFTTKFTGRGLGLAAVQGIVRSHFGAIAVESSAGQGTTFAVWLPAALQPSTAPAPSKLPVGSNGGTGVILVVDDEEIVRSLARTALSLAGYSVLEAHNGKDALALYSAHNGQIRMVLLDMLMPVMSGSETLRALRKFDPAVRVMCMSGYSAEEAHRQFGSGMHGFLQKPFTAHQLLKGVAQALEGAGGAGRIH